jgi:hypothetical protein
VANSSSHVIGKWQHVGSVADMVVVKCVIRNVNTLSTSPLGHVACWPHRDAWAMWIIVHVATVGNVVRNDVADCGHVSQDHVAIVNHVVIKHLASLPRVICHVANFFYFY